LRKLGPPPSSGATVGPYKLLEKVGSGGLATVYRATGLEGETVAIKVMNPEKTTEEQVKRIEREFKAMRRADSPYVVEVITSGEHQGYPWLALEFVEGQTLEGAIQDILERPPPERWKEVERLLRGLLAALGHIHGMGMVHRDLKPSNVMVTTDGQPKLTDFGSVKAPDAFTTNLTMAGHLVGTVAFMAPEQITEDRLDHRADLYALGATLYVMLTGRRPVEADSIAGYLAKHLMEDPRPPAEVDGLVPVKLSRICMRLLKKDPEQRFPTAEAVAEALDATEEVRRITLQGREGALRQVGLQLAGLRRSEGRAVAVLGLPGSGRSALLSAIEVAAAEAGVPCSRLDFPLSDSIERGLMKVIPGKGSFRKRLKAGAVLLLDDLDEARDADVRTLEAILRDPELQQSVLLYYALESSSDALPRATAELLERLISNLLLDPFESPLLCNPLTAKQVGSMMRDYGLSGAAAATLGRRLHGHCRGYPREIHAQLNALEESEWLRRLPDGSYDLTVSLSKAREDRLPVPDARRNEVLALFNQLPSASQAAVRAMSVLGQDVDTTVLESMSPGAGSALLAPEAAAFVLRRTEGMHELFRFGRPEMRQVVYDQLDLDERGRLHKKAAELLLARHQRRVGSIAEHAAEHLLAAGEAGRAYPLLVTAAQRAVRKRKLREARVLAEKALQVREWGKDELSDTLDPKLHQQALAVRGEVLLAMGRPEDARASLEAALQVSQTVADPVLVEVRARLGMALVDLGRPTEGREHLEAALAKLDLGSPVRFPTTRSLADALVAEGKVEEATRTWEKALAAAREEGSPGREGACLLGIGELELRRGNPMKAARALELAEGKLRKGRMARPLAICLERSADLALVDGRLRACIARADEAIRMAHELELGDVGVRAQLHKAEALLSGGADDECRALVQEVLSLEETSPMLDLWSWTTLHHLALQTLGHASAERVERSDKPPKAPNSSIAKWELYTAWAMIRDGSTGAARTHAQRSGDAAMGPGLAGVRLESLLCQATLGIPVDAELRELVQRGLSGMAPEMRRPFVERLRRLGIFKG